MIHNIDCIGNLLDSPLIVRLQGCFYAVLNVIRQSLGAVGRGVKDMGAMVAAARICVLMYADERSALHRFNGRCPVLQVGTFFLPQGVGVAGVEGDVLLPEQDGVYAVEPQHVPKAKDD